MMFFLSFFYIYIFVYLTLIKYFTKLLQYIYFLRNIMVTFIIYKNNYRIILFNIDLSLILLQNDIFKYLTFVNIDTSVIFSQKCNISL